jgi:hypothetical protein
VIAKGEFDLPLVGVAFQEDAVAAKCRHQRSQERRPIGCVMSPVKEVTPDENEALVWSIPPISVTRISTSCSEAWVRLISRSLLIARSTELLSFGNRFDDCFYNDTIVIHHLLL